MVDLFAGVHRIRDLLGRGSAYLRGALGIHIPLDPVLERLAREVFGELKRVPIIVPSRDLAEAVLQRLKRTEPYSPRASDDHGQVGHE